MFHQDCRVDQVDEYFDRDVYDHGEDGPPYKITRNEAEGRYLVAARDISAGETILKEEAYNWGPRYSTHPLCLGCYRYLEGPEDCTPCPRCGWPMCSSKCASNPEHGDKECRLFRDKPKLKIRDVKFNEIDPRYDVISPLRLLMDKGTSKWDSFMKLMSHLGNWKARPDWAESHRPVIQALQEWIPEVDEETVLKIFGIYYTNDFSSKIDGGLTKDGRLRPVSVIRQNYLLVSMASHSCMPNSFRIISPKISEKLVLELKASKSIPKGERILVHYVDCVLPNIIRQDILTSSKNFRCNCERCQDPTELGTFGSSYLCQYCRNEKALVSPKWKGTKWECKCDSCGKSWKDGDLVGFVKKVYEEFEEMTKDPSRCNVEEFESFILKYKEQLHPNHFLFCKLKYSLSGFYGRMPGYEMNNITPKMLLRKKIVSRECLQVYEKIFPGISIEKGMLMYELHMPLIMLTQLESQVGGMDEDEAYDNFCQALEYLKNSLNHLYYEDPESFEGQVYQGAKTQVEPLEEFVENYGY